MTSSIISEPLVFHSFPWLWILEASQQTLSLLCLYQREETRQSHCLTWISFPTKLQEWASIVLFSFYYWIIGFKEIDPFQLHVTPSTENCLKIIDQTIWLALKLEIPCWLNDIHIIFSVNYFPRTHGFESFYFSDGCFPIFIRKLTIHGLTEICIIPLTSICFIFQKQRMYIIDYEIFSCILISTVILIQGNEVGNCSVQ